MKRPDLSKLKHSLVNSPLHFYTEVTDDGNEVLRHIRVQQKVYEVPADGITIDTVPPDSVDSSSIKNESVEKQDLHRDVQDTLDKMENAATIGEQAVSDMVADAIRNATSNE